MGMRPVLLTTWFSLYLDRTQVCIFAGFAGAGSPLVALTQWFLGAILIDEGSQVIRGGLGLGLQLLLLHW